MRQVMNSNDTTIVLQAIAHQHFGKSVSWIPLNPRRTVFEAVTNSGSWVVKLARHGLNDAIVKEYNLLNYLADTDIPVASLVTTEPQHTLGTSYLVMERINGIPVSQCVPNDPTPYRQMGKLLALTHQLDLSIGKPPLLESASGAQHYWDATLSRAKLLTDHRIIQPTSFKILQQSSLPNCEGKSLCHSDFSPHQCIANGSKLITIVDWEAAWAGNPQVDLQIAMGYLKLMADEVSRQAFCQGYEATSNAKVLEIPVLGMIYCVNYLFSIYSELKQHPSSWQHAVQTGIVSKASNLLDEYATRSLITESIRSR